MTTYAPGRAQPILPAVPQQTPDDPDLKAKQAAWDQKYAECEAINKAKGVEAIGSCRRDLGPRPVSAPRVKTQEELDTAVEGASTNPRAGSTVGSPVYWAARQAAEKRRQQTQADFQNKVGQFAPNQSEGMDLSGDTMPIEDQLDQRYGPGAGAAWRAKQPKAQTPDEAARQYAERSDRQNAEAKAFKDNQPTEVIRRMIEERRKEDDMTDMVRGANDKYDKEREKFAQDKATAAKRLTYSPPARPASQPQETSADAAQMTPEQIQYQNEQAYIKRMAAERERQRLSASAARPIAG